MNNKQVKTPDTPGTTSFRKKIPLSSTPPTALLWRGDECFEYFNPFEDASLEHWAGAWVNALFVASKQLVADMSKNRELRGDARSWV